MSKEQNAPRDLVMPVFKPMVSDEQLEELAILPPEARHIQMPVIRSLSINDQRAVFHFNVTCEHDREIWLLKQEREKRNSQLSNAGLWILGTLFTIFATALALKYIHP